jgi:hypothetical protein
VFQDHMTITIADSRISNAEIAGAKAGRVH